MEIQVFLNKINFLKIGIFIFPLILIILFSPSSPILTSNNYTYIEFITEDGPIENLTSFFYLLSSIFLILISVFFIKKGKKLFGFFYLFLAISFIFAFFEEINWGQRMYNIQVPEFFLRHSADQLSVHNLPSLQPYEPIFWAVIGFWGAFGWTLFLILGKTKKKFLLKILIPSWFFTTYFFPMLIFRVVRFFDNNIIQTYSDFINTNILLNHNDEMLEFLVSVGVIFLIFSVCFRLKFRGLDIEPENNRKKISIKKKL